MDSGLSEGIPKVPWKTGDVVLGLAIVLVVAVIVFVGYALVSDGVREGETDLTDSGATPGLIVAAVVLYAVALLVAVILGPLRHRTSVTTLGLGLPPSSDLPRLALQIGLFLGGSLLFSLAYAGVLSLLGLDEISNQTEEIALEGPAIVASVIVFVVWAPFVEEVFFRGFVLPGLVGWMGLACAAVVSSVLFALVHGDPRVMIPVFVIGMLLAWLYRKNGSLWSCFGAHAIWNGAVFAIGVTS